MSTDKLFSDTIASLQVSRDQMRAVASGMYKELEAGLAKDGTTLKMIPSYVSRLPTGTEKGVFLALDLGGTNFRVCSVKLLGNKRVELDNEKYSVSDELKTGEGEALFDFIAGCVQDYINTRKLQPEEGKPIKLGFTFSFPVKQSAINHGVLMHWNKGFTCANVVDQDVVSLQQKAFDKKGLKIEITAIVNDTVGTLVARAYPKPNTVMGVILGTGTNAAYIEDLAAVTKFKGFPYATFTGSIIANLNSFPTKSHDLRVGKAPTDKMVINTEWGAFDNEKKVLKLTKYDEQIDQASNNPNSQIFEKAISGMYLGEITRLALVGLVQGNALLGGKVSSELSKAKQFGTEFMSDIEADTTPALNKVEEIFSKHLGYPSTTLTDRQLIKSLVQQVGTRAARLSAAAIFAVLEKMGLPKNDEVVVAIDGTLWIKYPGFSDRLGAALKELMGDKAALVQLDTASDGSGMGAGLIAALA
ncbi:hexokinase [Sorochytrium milnesiophthora]